MPCATGRRAREEALAPTGLRSRAVRLGCRAGPPSQWCVTAKTLPLSWSRPRRPPSRSGLAGLRGAKTWRLPRGRGSPKKDGVALNPETIIHTTISDPGIDRRIDDWIPSPLYRKHWSQIYFEYGCIYYLLRQHDRRAPPWLGVHDVTDRNLRDTDVSTVTGRERM